MKKYKITATASGGKSITSIYVLQGNFRLLQMSLQATNTFPLITRAKNQFYILSAFNKHTSHL